MKSTRVLFFLSVFFVLVLIAAWSNTAEGRSSTETTHAPMTPQTSGISPSAENIIIDDQSENYSIRWYKPRDLQETAGVALWGSSGVLSESVIRGVAPRPLDGAFGYGLQIEGLPNAPATLLHVQRSQVLDASVAGILYFRATGTIPGSVVSGADFAVVYSNAPAPPTDGGGNLLESRAREGISRQQLEPAPAPPPVEGLE